MFDGGMINEVETDKIIGFIQSEIEIAKTLESICFDNHKKKCYYQNRIVFEDLL